MLKKGGEIIPKIVDVDISSRQTDAKKGKICKPLPGMRQPLCRIEGEAAWVCPNRYACPPQIVGRIEHFVGRRMMNIDGIGEETAQALYDNGLIKDIADLYSLDAQSLLTLDGFGNRSAERVLEGLEASRQVPFERVVFALSIPFVGDTTAKKKWPGLHGT